MTDDADHEPRDGERERGPRVLSPGYFACRRAIDRLGRFQDLARHHQGWAHQIDFARPLDQLLPGGYKPAQEPWVIQRELNRLIPAVLFCLQDAGIPTTVIHRHGASEHRSDLIANYFELLRCSSDAETFDLLIATLDRGIGVCEAAKSNAIYRKLNPMHWVAYLMRLPLTLLELAGLTDKSTPGGIVKAYAWLVRLLVLLILCLAATRLGISIPWDRLLTFIAK